MMSRLRALIVGTLLIAGPAAADPGDASPTARKPRPQRAMRCFALSEKVIGVDRICYYRCAGVTVTSIAVRADELCPIFIDK
jgi:hypothetical protein